MRHIPIIFSTDMVLGLLAGRKTMTRRLAWKTTVSDGGAIRDAAGGQMDYVEPHLVHKPTPWQKVKPGDVLWVKERLARGPTGQVVYYADNRFADIKHQWIWENQDAIPSIHCPKAISRICIVIEATKVEPIQNMTDDDARREGIFMWDNARANYSPDWHWKPRSADVCAGYPTPVGAFHGLWRSLHGEESWQQNPEVVAMSGRVVFENIMHDQFRIAA